MCKANQWFSIFLSLASWDLPLALNIASSGLFFPPIFLYMSLAQDISNYLVFLIHTQRFQPLLLSLWGYLCLKGTFQYILQNPLQYRWYFLYKIISKLPLSQHSPCTSTLLYLHISLLQHQSYLTSAYCYSNISLLPSTQLEFNELIWMTAEHNIYFYTGSGGKRFHVTPAESHWVLLAGKSAFQLLSFHLVHIYMPVYMHIYIYIQYTYRHILNAHCVHMYTHMHVCDTHTWTLEAMWYTKRVLD